MLINRLFTAVREFVVGKPASLRSSKWETARKHHLQVHNTCSACGDTKELQVHHIKPFHVHPELELDPTNFITLCEGKDELNCHLYIGHHGNWKFENVDVVLEAQQSLQSKKSKSS